MGVEEFQGGLSDGAESGVVISVEFRVGFQGFKVKITERLYLGESFLSEGNSEKVGEVHDGVIGGRRAVSGNWKGSRVVVVVKGFIQVADVISWCDADQASLLVARRGSGARSLGVLARSLSVQLFSISEDRIRAERVNGVHI